MDVLRIKPNWSIYIYVSPGIIYYLDIERVCVCGGTVNAW